MSRNRSRAVALGLAVILTASACAAQVEPPRGDPPAADPAARVGGTLRIGITAPGRIDPIGAATPGARLVTQAMCDTLVQLDPVTRQVKAGLAKSWVEADNGSFITFMPLHDQRFSDGTVLKASDLNESLKAQVAAYNGSPFARLAQVFAKGVLGSQAKDATEVNPLLLQGTDAAHDPAQILDDYDVQVKASPNNGAALRLFADPSFAPVSAAALADDYEAFVAKPACVGPYTLTAPYRSDATSITLERNRDYPASNLGFTRGGAGYADRLVFTIYPDDEAAYRAYRAGQVDIAPLPVAHRTTPGVPATDVVVGAATGIDYIGLSASSGTPLLKRREVRQALSLVLDRRKLAAMAGAGTAPATGFLPPSLQIAPGDGPSESGLSLLTCASASSPTPQVAAARALLARAGIDLRGQPIPLEFDDAPASQAVAAEVGRQWEQALGVKVQPLIGLWSAYSTVASSYDGYRAAFLMSWATDAVVPVPGVPEVATYLRQLFTSPTAENSNWAKWNDKTFDKQVEQGLGDTSDQRSREQTVAQLGARLCEELPYVPVTQTATPWLMRAAAVGGARTVRTGVDGLPLLRELYMRKG